MYLTLQHSSGYQPPSGCNLLFFGDTKPLGWRLIFNHSSGYTPPSGCAVIFNSGGSGGSGDNAIPSTPLGASIWGIGTHCLWGELTSRDRQARGHWRQVRRVDRTHFFAVRDSRRAVDKNHTSAWRQPKRKLERTHLSAWGEYGQHIQRQHTAPWRNKRRCEREYTFAWGELTPYDREKLFAWNANPRRIYAEKTFAWGAYPPKDRQFLHPWGNPPPVEIHHRTVWGRKWYERICLQEYEIPECGRLIFYHQSDYQIPSGCNLILQTESYTYDVRCKQREPSGWRDNYFYIPGGKKWTPPPKLKVYITVNSALLHRLSDNKPIEASFIELKADIDSWCWGFSARVSKTGLDTMLPGGEPCEVEAVINGFRWIILVEDWQDNRGFASAAYSVTGRSRTAMLSEKYAPKRGGSNGEEAAAQQLATEQLENTGFALDWQIEDWLVAAGALNYSMATPIKVIQQIAEAAGARVISHRTKKQLLVIPRLHSKPWQWAGKTPDIAVSDYIVRKIAGDTMNSPPVNAVFLSGVNAGITAKVVREGTAGELLAPMVTEPLITAVEAARQRGLDSIGRSGKWRKERLEMRLFSDMAPGLAELGQLLVMEETNAIWFGQVASVTIRCDLQPEFEVTQYLDVERYYGK